MTRNTPMMTKSLRRAGGSFLFGGLLLLLPGLSREAAAQVPPPPTLISPTGTVYSNGTTVNPTYTWNKVTTATQYRLYVHNGTASVVDTWYNSSAICSGSTCSATPAAQLPAGTYTWKVQSKNTSGTSGWSLVLTFNAAPQTWNGTSKCTGEIATGDFNGDGRSDRFCSLNKVGNVSLATPTGFAAPTPWIYEQISRLLVADVNNDGESDVIEYDAAGHFWVLKSNGSGFEAPEDWGYGASPETTCKIAPVSIGVGDFNGDGLLDVWCKRAEENPVFVGLQNASSTAFTFSVWGSGGCDSTGATRVGVAELTGDGKDDWYCISDSSGLFRAYPSNGTTFQANVFTAFGPFCAISLWTLADLNGDGRLDVYCPANGKVAFSTGRTFLEKIQAIGIGGIDDIMGLDVDGDGASEIVVNKAGNPSNDIQVSKWTGTTLSPWEIWKGTWCDDHIAPGDFTGDGKIDLLCMKDHTKVVSAGTAGVLPDLIVSAGNGLGGTTTVQYTPTSTFPNDNNPAVRPVVTAITLNDGRGGLSTSTFTYEGSRIDRAEREFLGFRKMKATAPCIQNETVCPYTETTMSQALASIGAPILVERKDGSGLVSTTSSIYDDTTTLPRTSKLASVDNTIHEGSNSKSTNTTFDYDDFHNVTQQVFSGDASAPGDELHTDTSFTPNTSAFIVNRPGRIEQRSSSGGDLVSCQEMLYDNAGAWNQAPVKGNLTKIRNLLFTGNGPSTCTGTFASRTFGYDTYGNLTSETDETARTSTTTFDGTNHLFPISLQNPAGETATSTWDATCGVLTLTTDPNGQNTGFQYDSLCRITRTDAPLAGFELRSYVGLGNPNLQNTRVETNPPTGATANLFAEEYYDGLGRVYRTRRRGPSASQTIATDQTYNARGETETSTAPFYENEAPQVTEYEYDFQDRPTVTTHPDGATIETSYGLWSVTRTDENGKPTTTRYDAYGRVVIEERSLNGQTLQTESTYDTLGRLIGMTDALGNSWSWTVDSLGRTVGSSDPDAGSSSYLYDAAGRVTKHTDAKGQVTTVTYDTGGRLATKTSGVGVTTLAYGDASAGFFNVGRLTTVTSPGTVVRSDYDSLGRAAKVTRTLDGVDYVAQKRYDAAGHVTGITYPDGDALGTVISPLLYDSAGRLRAVPGIVTNVIYDASGRTTQRTNANGTQTTWTYSPDRGFLQAIQTSGPTQVQSLSYTIDPAGLVEQVTSSFPNESWSYGYDDLYRVTQATSLTSPAESQSFAYDELGRVTYNSRVGSYAYAVVGQPRPHAPSSVNGGTYLYDPNGNLCSKGGSTCTSGTTTYQWDAENRITQIGTTQFKYDAFGERLKKTGATATSRYPFEDDYEITNGTITKYVAIEGLGVVAKRVGSTTYWLHTDHQGSIQAITGAMGSVIYRRTYRPYGQTITETTSHTESRGWIDQRQDVETGLTYLHARYYDPNVGTFLSPDPLGPEGGLNAFAYGSGNPANLTDRSGLYSCPSAICIQVGYPWGQGDDPYNFGFGDSTTVSGTLDPRDFWNAIFGPFNAISDLLGRLFGGGGSGVGLGGGGIPEPSGIAGKPPGITVGGETGPPSNIPSPILAVGADPGDGNPGGGGPGGGGGGAGSGINNHALDVMQAEMIVENLELVNNVYLELVPMVAMGGGPAAATRLGKAGEVAVRAARNIGPKTRILINGRIRVPDGMLAHELNEVKNVLKAYRTGQLRDYMDISRETFRRFNLWLRRGAKASKPLQDDIDAGRINRLDIP
jgi:RHS repeat-associated protein